MIAIGSSIIAGLVTEQSGSESSGTAAAYLLILPYLGIYLPLKANGIYYEWCRGMINGSAQHFAGQPEQQKAWLTNKGGVDQVVPLVMIIALLLLSLLGGPPPELVSQ